jgi:hypothetical protein
MTVKVTLSTIQDWGYTNFGARMFEKATFISTISPNLRIIDSYSVSATPNRYIGDPIADGIWTVAGDVNNENSWIVVECITHLYPTLSLPNWQCKYQWVNAAAFDDVSGLDYDMEGDVRVIAVRFAPYGGWDFDPSTPDFSGPAGQLSGSNKKVGTSSAPGTLLRNIYYEDVGQFMHLVQYKDVGTNELIKTLTTVMGDFTVIDSAAQTMPRLHMNTTFGNTVIDPPGNNSWICEDNFWSNTALTSWSDIHLGIGYEAPNGTWTEEAFQTQTSDLLVNEYSQPTQHTTLFEMDVEPYLINTYSNGPIGELPGIGKIYGIGQDTFAANTWLSMGGQTCLAMRWDPTVSF